MSEIIVAPSLHRAAREAAARNQAIRRERFGTVFELTPGELDGYACIVFAPGKDFPRTFRPNFLLYPVDAVPGHRSYLLPTSEALALEL